MAETKKPKTHLTTHWKPIFTRKRKPRNTVLRCRGNRKTGKPMWPNRGTEKTKNRSRKPHKKRLRKPKKPCGEAGESVCRNQKTRLGPETEITEITGKRKTVWPRTRKPQTVETEKHVSETANGSPVGRNKKWKWQNKFRTGHRKRTIKQVTAKIPDNGKQANELCVKTAGIQLNIKMSSIASPCRILLQGNDLEFGPLLSNWGMILWLPLNSLIGVLQQIPQEMLQSGWESVREPHHHKAPHPPPHPLNPFHQPTEIMPSKPTMTPESSPFQS